MAKDTGSAAPAALTGARKAPDVVQVPAWMALAIDGEGAPGDAAFQDGVGALYGVGYMLRFTRKDQGRPVFKVAPLIGEWRAEGVDLEDTGVPSPDTWRWRLMISLPDDVTADDLAAAVEAATTKKGGKVEGAEAPGRLIRVRNEPARWGRILHVGPYATEPESFEKLHGLLEAEGLRREPWHVEVYLSDPGRTAPEKLKTALLVRVA